MIMHGVQPIRLSVEYSQYDLAWSGASNYV